MKTGYKAKTSSRRYLRTPKTDEEKSFSFEFVSQIFVCLLVAAHTKADYTVYQIS